MDNQKKKWTTKIRINFQTKLYAEITSLNCFKEHMRIEEKNI